MWLLRLARLWLLPRHAFCASDAGTYDMRYIGSGGGPVVTEVELTITGWRHVVFLPSIRYYFVVLRLHSRPLWISTRARCTARSPFHERLQHNGTPRPPHSLDNVCAEPNPSDSRYLDGLHKSFNRHQDFPRTAPKDMVSATPNSADLRTIHPALSCSY